MTVLCLAVATVVGDLPPGTRRNTYLPPEPTKGYNYNTPKVPFPTRTPPTRRPSIPTGPTRPTPTFPTGPPRPPTYPTPGTRPTPGGGGYPTPGPPPTPGFPDYPGYPTGNNGNTIRPPGDVSI